MRTKILLKQTMKKGVAIRQERQPILRHQAEGFYVKRAELLATGVMQVGDEQLEFHDIRVFLTDKPI